MTNALPKRRLDRRILYIACAVTLLFFLLTGFTLWAAHDAPSESTLAVRSFSAADIHPGFAGRYEVSTGGMTYKLRLDRAERDDLAEGIARGASFTALVEENGSDTGRIWHLADESGHIYLPFNRALERERNDGWHNSGFLVAVPLMLWAALIRMARPKAQPNALPQSAKEEYHA